MRSNKFKLILISPKSKIFIIVELSYAMTLFLLINRQKLLLKVNIRYYFMFMLVAIFSKHWWNLSEAKVHRVPTGCSSAECQR